MTILLQIELKQSQFRGPLKWECTLLGEKRIVTHQKLSFPVKSLEEAAGAVNLDEVDRMAVLVENETPVIPQQKTPQQKAKK